MKFKNVKVYGLYESMIRSGYPMQVGEPMELKYEYPFQFVPDERDVGRALKLSNTPNGSGHNNFLKGIIVQFDLQYPEYFSPQLQRYHWIDIVSSQSKMHSLTKIKDIKDNCNKYVLSTSIYLVNKMISFYNEESIYPIKLGIPSIFNFDEIEYEFIEIQTKQELFQYIISNLPMGFELWMGMSTNYLQLKTIYNQRKHHKLSEWKEFCDWIKTLPMSELITGNND